MATAVLALAGCESNQFTAPQLDGPTTLQAQQDGDVDPLCSAVPLDVVLVLDRSGSMVLDPDGDGSTKLQDVQAASTNFVDRLTSADQAGLVSFSDVVTVDQPLTFDHSLVNSAIASLSPGGLTNIGGAVDAGHNELDTNGRMNATPILVVLSNGLQNIGPDAVTEAQQAKDAGIRVITIAFGASADEAALKQMASDPKDENFFDADSDNVDDVFETIVQEICPTEVEIDIKPGSDPNSINLRNIGDIPVAILTTSDFDATTVDASTVRFGDLEEVQMADGGASVSHEGGHIEDVDDDGDMDFVGHFPTQDTGFEGDDTAGWLVGETTGGESIAGRQSVRLLGG